MGLIESKNVKKYLLNGLYTECGIDGKKVHSHTDDLFLELLLLNFIVVMENNPCWNREQLYDLILGE